jgi:N-acetylneuraminic acid mutarotase
MPFPRSGFPAIGVINGILYSAGGWNGYHDDSTFQSYDPVSNTWTILADMPQGRYQGDGAGVINEKLYVPGGWSTFTRLPQNTLFIYDPTTNTWSSGANMLRLSGEGATGVINNMLYVMTPADGYSGWYQFFDQYDPTSNTWTNLPNIPNIHINPGYGVISGKFYVVGGFDGNNSDVTGILDMYDPTIGSWTTLSPMPTARQSVASAVLNGQLYVIGGSDTTPYLNIVEAYDPVSDTWSTQTSMPTARNSCEAGTINNQFYVVGGTNPSNIAYSDVNHNNIVDQGDTLSVQFDRQVQVNGATPSDFFLLVNGDSLGTGATVSINSANNTQVIITLGSSPKLTIYGTPTSTAPGSPSGMDISATITPGHITDLETGVNAVNSGQPGVNDFAFGMVYAVSDNTTAISAATGGTAQVAVNFDTLYTNHKLIIPAGSLASDVSIDAGKPGDPHGAISAVLFSSSSTITFSQSTPATLVLEFKDTDTQQEAGNLPTSMRIFQYSTTAQRYLLVPQTYGLQSVDLVNKQVSIPITLLDVFNQGIIQPFANIALPTVDSQSYNIGPAPQSILHPFTNNLVLTVGTSGIYTLHQLVIPDYQLTVSGFTISLEQASLQDKNGWQNNAVFEIITNANPTTQPILTMQYMNHTDPYGQFSTDLITGIITDSTGQPIAGNERQMRIYRWLADTSLWVEIPGTQTVDFFNHTVTVTIPDALTTAQVYAVGVDTSASATTDVKIPWELFDQEYIPSSNDNSNAIIFDIISDDVKQ